MYKRRKETVERSFADSKQNHGYRYAQYRGKAKVQSYAWLSCCVQRLNKQMKGEGDVDNIDILGNTTESAIQATKQALYNLDHPLEYVPKSIEVQRACMKEREFYVAFLERLEKL